MKQVIFDLLGLWLALGLLVASAFGILRAHAWAVARTPDWALEHRDYRQHVEKFASLRVGGLLRRHDLFNTIAFLVIFTAMSVVGIDIGVSAGMAVVLAVFWSYLEVSRARDISSGAGVLERLERTEPWIRRARTQYQLLYFIEWFAYLEALMFAGRIVAAPLDF
jgi:hypothetical protein